MNKKEIIELLEGANDKWLFEQSAKVKTENIGDKVYLRGLIETSNICARDCLYCGIRKSNVDAERYTLTKEQVLAGAQLAIDKGFGSVVLQSGERHDTKYLDFIEECVKEIKQQGEVGITLSLGEQSEKTFQRWREAGAHRYLLRIESSSPELFKKIHPADSNWHKRLECLEMLRKGDWQVGTGVMIGLPGQNIENLADDLIFMKTLDIDMCGMGPYIEHAQTPMGTWKSNYSNQERVKLTLRMIALLRLLLPKINMAATTALHTLDNQGREKGIAAGANILMPNVTPPTDRTKYLLYSGKVMDDINLQNFNIGFKEWGDSKHFSSRKNN